MDPSPGKLLWSWHLEVPGFQPERNCSAKCKKQPRSTTTFLGEASVAAGRQCCGAAPAPSWGPRASLRVEKGEGKIVHL